MTCSHLHTFYELEYQKAGINNAFEAFFGIVFAYKIGVNHILAISES